MDLYRRNQSASDILDRSVTLYRQNFIRLLAVSAAVQISYLITTILLDVDSSHIISSAMLNTMTLALTMAVLTASISQVYLGQIFSIRAALPSAILCLPAIAPAAALAALVNALLSNFQFRSSDFISLMLTFALNVLRAAAFLFLLFPIQFSVLEDYRWRAHWVRMAWIVIGSFRHVLKTFLALGAAFVLVNGVVYIFGGALYLMLLAEPLRRVDVSSFIAQYVVTTSGSVLSAPFVTAALTMLYYDLRCRQEGLDLETRLQTLARETNG